MPRIVTFHFTRAWQKWRIGVWGEIRYNREAGSKPQDVGRFLEFARLDFARYDGLDVSHIALAVRPLSLAGHRPCPVPDLLEHLSQFHLLPVVGDDNRLMGVICDTDVLAHGSGVMANLQDFNLSDTPALLEEAPLAQARRLFYQHPAHSLIPLVDTNGRYTGECASRQMLLRLLRNNRIKPPRMGGMATPFGVYMTSGRYVGGAGMKGLLATGVLFAGVIFATQSTFLFLWTLLTATYPVVGQLNGAAQALAELLFTLGVILVGIRLTPMGGLHAAEHMTINAVEAGLPLTIETVRPMPRVHLRCGTNLMALIGGVEIAWLSLESIRPYLNPIGEGLYTVVWVVAVASLWKPLGAWLQTHFTTKRPTNAQLQSGIAAGQDILQQFEAAPHGEVGFWRRLLNSGILHLVAVFSITMWALENALWWLLEQWPG